MKPNRFLILAAVLLFTSSAVKAQDSIRPPANEIYVSFSNFSPLNIGLRYKRQSGPNSYFKVGLVSLSANVNRYLSDAPAAFPVTNSSYSGGIELGVEWRKTVSKKLALFHGPALRALLQYNEYRNMNPSLPPEQQKRDYMIYTGMIPYTIGTIFNVFSGFYLAAEINPSVYISNSDNSGNGHTMNTINGGFTLDTRNAMISLVYRY